MIVVDHDIFCIWNNDLVESKKEFVAKFVELTSAEENKEGLYTFLFSRYVEYKIITETLYCIVYEGTAVFLWYTPSLVLTLDNSLKVMSGDFIEKELNVMNGIVELENIEYLGQLHDGRGNFYEAFTLVELEANENAKHLFNNNLIDVSRIKDENDIMDVSLEFLLHTIEKFENEVDTAIENDGGNASLEENPYANAFYDREIIANIAKQHKKTIIAHQSDI